MLGRSYNTALPFAEDLVHRGVLLLAAPSSVLGELCSLSTPVDLLEVKVADHQNQYSDYGMQMNYHSSNEGGGLWCASFDNTVEELSKAISTHIGFIRNVVVPRTLEFSKETLGFIEELGRSDASQDLTIERAVIPEITQDPTFLGFLEPYKFRSVLTPTKYSLDFPFSEVPENILSVASLSNARLDSLVMEWTKSIDMHYLRAVWHSFFAKGAVNEGYSGPFVSQDDMKSPNLYVRLNVSLAYYLLANYYLNHFPDITTTEPITSIERRIREHLEYAATTLIKTLEDLMQANQASIMVTYIDTSHKKITVSNEIYERWLATGGNVEIILGLLVSGKYYTTVKEIDEQSERLKQEWSNYVNIHIETIEYKKANLLRQFYQQLLSKYLLPEYQDDVEKSFLATRPDYVQTTLQKADKYLHTLTKDQLSDVQCVAKELIPGMKYGFTYAKKFICDMDELGMLSENMIPEEAAFVATVNYIADYILGQIQVVKI